MLLSSKSNISTLVTVDGNVTVSSGGLLTLNGGLITIGSGSSLALNYSNGLTIPATGGFDLTGGTLSTGHFSITNNGLIRVNSGTLDFGQFREYHPHRRQRGFYRTEWDC